MTPEQRHGLVRQLHRAIDGMDLPSFRIQLMSDANLLWLQRNIQINNAEHPNINEAQILIKKILSKTN